MKSEISNSQTAEYRAWYSMIYRCTNSECGNYHRHGGRGIRVCNRWLESFDAFLEDIGKKPNPGLTLDRIDNDGDYTPENCRWATRKQQSRNSRQNHNVTFQGRTQCLAAWAEEIGVKAGILQARLKKGWSVERTLTERVGKGWWCDAEKQPQRGRIGDSA